MIFSVGNYEVLVRPRPKESIVQVPNLPLMGWVFFTLLCRLTWPGRAYQGSRRLARFWLFTWAYLELRSGTNLYRRALGVLVLAPFISSLYSKE